MSQPEWIKSIIPLDRPEYAQQSEALLTDLLWRSPGSSLSQRAMPRKRVAVRGKQQDVDFRLIYQGSRDQQESTYEIALSSDISRLFNGAGETELPTKALLDSIQAPKSRRVRSMTCIPLNNSSLILQNLHGIVNKQGPPNLADIIENIGWMGGSEGVGHVASSFLEGTISTTSSGFYHFLDLIFPIISDHVWNEIVEKSANQAKLERNWAEVKALYDYRRESRTSPLAAYSRNTPFAWFWDKWEALCDPSNDWYEVLPTRRFIDWSTCLLRSALSFTFLWEARFFVLIYETLYERHLGNDSGYNRALHELQVMLNSGVTLATIESKTVPTSQKNAWRALDALLQKGYVARSRIEAYLKQHSPQPISEHEDLFTFLKTWVESLPEIDLQQGELLKLDMPLDTNSNTAKNTKYLVRYSLLARESDDDTRDQADFYYLAKANSRNTWFEPGPEWLVVVTSLLARRPGEPCTLGLLLEDLRKLGIRIERRILVSLLEEAGLTADSPDADDALVIQPAFRGLK